MFAVFQCKTAKRGLNQIYRRIKSTPSTFDVLYSQNKVATENYKRRSAETYRTYHRASHSQLAQASLAWPGSGNERITKALLNGELVVSKRTVGRSRLRYKDASKCDPKNFNIGLEEWGEFSNDCIEWCSLITQKLGISERQVGRPKESTKK